MDDMPRKLQLHVTRQKSGKKWYYYHRVDKGPRTPLPAPNEEGFLEAYRAAELGTPIKPKRKREDVKSVRWLIDRYKESSAWKPGLDDSTRRQRDNIFTHVIDKIGNEDFHDIDRQSIIASMEARSATPAQANVLLKAMKGLFKWALKNNHVTVDPTVGVEWLRYKTDGFPAWNMEDVKAFCAKWPIGTMQRLAMELGLVTGLRRSDIHIAGRQHLRGNILTITTVKTNTEVTVEIPPRLLSIIEATPRHGLHFIESSQGKPFTVESFGNWFRDACRKADLTDKNMHGLRKLAATLAADGGATAHQLMSQFGWANVKQAEHYTKRADRRRLGVASSRLVAEQIEAELPPTNIPELGDSGNKVVKSKGKC
jgi:integrase